MSDYHSDEYITHLLECIYNDSYTPLPSPSDGLHYCGNDDKADALDAELDFLLEGGDSPTIQFNSSISINSQTPHKDVLVIMSDLERRHKHSVKQLRNKLCDLGQYDHLSDIKVQACIDFIDVKFTTTEPHNRSDIKKYLTEKTGIKHFIKTADESDDVLSDEKNNNINDSVGTTFIIRLHDVENLKMLTERIDHLKHYNVNLDPEIVRVERAIDFYNVPQEMRIALFKAVKLSEANNCRFYYEDGTTKGKVLSIFDDKHDIIDGNTIYINDKDSDHSYRIYFKTTDFNGLPLRIEEYRVRFEETYSGDALLKLNGGQPVKIRDFATVIKGMSKALSFTKLKDNAFPYFRSGYRDIAAPYALKKETKQGLNGIKKTRRNNGNVRPLSKYLVTYTEFNQIVAKSQHKLAAKFLIKN